LQSKIKSSNIFKMFKFVKFPTLSSQKQENRPCCLHPSPTLIFFEIALQEDMHFNIVQLNGAMNELNMCNFHLKCLPYLRLVGYASPSSSMVDPRLPPPPLPFSAPYLRRSGTLISSWGVWRNVVSFLIGVWGRSPQLPGVSPGAAPRF
jgi:hypothetical protein